ncbi:PREDICTED: tetratricopeptide repeat protein 19, mitochondrial [Elephantulus edwardii]|uniref:tetratricopeptide repeat protein 19, mitochondrial n=1 Tax=Elephantulus edwardii TaxID=28737 RepID=UPI0003F0E7EE|nr:PREDICTED: tetratricopeptide repeat protein 19, mitochondrial [Elephantulus edwardii]
MRVARDVAGRGRSEGGDVACVIAHAGGGLGAGWEMMSLCVMAHAVAITPLVGRAQGRCTGALTAGGGLEGTMCWFLRTVLAAGLLRAAGRPCWRCAVRLLPGPAGGRAVDGPSSWLVRRCRPGLLPLVAALSWFSKPAAAGEEKQRAGESSTQDASEATEAEIIELLKRAKLSIMKDEPEEAELILHDALRLAHQSGNHKAITYTYDLMANLAFIRGQLENAEKLFKATMSYLLEGGMKQEDNAIIEISLKLASIYAAQNRQEFALAGYEFCISTLEEKMEREKDLAEDVMSAEEKANTHLLLGMCLDTYARYLLFAKQPSQALKMYEKALQISEEIQGERHPQTIVLMNDLATTLDAQGHFDEAFIYVQRASDLARQTRHPELHMVLSNLAAILIHRERYAQAREIYQEALKQAELKKDELSIQHIREELAELSRKTALLGLLKMTFFTPNFIEEV